MNLLWALLLFLFGGAEFDFGQLILDLLTKFLP